MFVAILIREKSYFHVHCRLYLGFNTDPAQKP
jgi:hypothetical protein